MMHASTNIPFGSQNSSQFSTSGSRLLESPLRTADALNEILPLLLWCPFHIFMHFLSSS